MAAALCTVSAPPAPSGHLTTKKRPQQSSEAVQQSRAIRHAALFVAESVDEWVRPQSLAHNGLLVKRPFDGKWDALARDIDDSASRIGETEGLTCKVENGSPGLLSARLRDSVRQLLAVADLPPPLSEQIISDAQVMGVAFGSMCPTARQLEVKLEIIGRNTCARWHQDHFVGRAITTYTGHSGTVYTRDDNVDFWELTHCGKNECVIRDADLIESVGVGDILFIKGTQFSSVFGGANGLVHKSPEKDYHEDGRIVNRLVLKIDVGTFGPAAEASARAVAMARAAEVLEARNKRAKPLHPVLE